MNTRDIALAIRDALECSTVSTHHETDRGTQCKKTK